MRVVPGGDGRSTRLEPGAGQRARWLREQSDDVEDDEFRERRAHVTGVRVEEVALAVLLKLVAVVGVAQLVKDLRDEDILLELCRSVRTYQHLPAGPPGRHHVVEGLVPKLGQQRIGAGVEDAADRAGHLGERASQDLRCLPRVRQRLPGVVWAERAVDDVR